MERLHLTFPDLPVQLSAGEPALKLQSLSITRSPERWRKRGCRLQEAEGAAAAESSLVQGEEQLLTLCQCHKPKPGRNEPGQAVQGDVGPLKHALEDSSMAAELGAISPPCSPQQVFVVHTRAHLCYLLLLWASPGGVWFGRALGAGRGGMAWQ